MTLSLLIVLAGIAVATISWRLQALLREARIQTEVLGLIAEKLGVTSQDT